MTVAARGVKVLESQGVNAKQTAKCSLQTVTFRKFSLSNENEKKINPNLTPLLAAFPRYLSRKGRKVGISVSRHISRLLSLFSLRL